MRNFNETNGSASLLGRVGKKLLGSTAITAAGLMSLSVSAKAADDWTGHIIDSGSTTVDISIPDETAEKMKAVQDVVKYITEKQG